MRSSALVVLVLSTACGGGSQLPPPPPYVPEMTPEPVTSCPEEAKRAKETREQAMAQEGIGADGTARIVFQHAECERRVFDGMVVTEHAEIAVARAQFQSTRNLYQEVANYGVPAWTITARVRIGDLIMAWAAKVRGISAPAGMDPTQWRIEQDETVAVLEREAGGSYHEALVAADRAGSSLIEPQAKRHVEEACDRLAAIDAPAAESAASCKKR